MTVKSFNLDDRRYKIMEEFDKVFPPPKPNPMPEMVNEERPWITEYFDDFVIVCDKSTNYIVRYKLDGEKVELAPRSEWKEALSSRIWVAVKAVSEWELDVLAIPFDTKDSDGQWFDEDTDIMSGAFGTPLVLYQHGVKQGGKSLEGKPLVVGKTVPGTLVKQSDGWHIRVVLNKTIKQAKDIMDAAWKKLVAVSSDSISHLARLEVGGKFIQYEKNKPGRIAVWPFAGVSLWELGNGNFRPANRTAMALPAMKAIYREAGMPFPELGTSGATEADEVKKRARIEAIRIKSKSILAKAEGRNK